MKSTSRIFSFLFLTFLNFSYIAFASSSENDEDYGYAAARRTVASLRGGYDRSTARVAAAHILDDEDDIGGYGGASARVSRSAKPSEPRFLGRFDIATYPVKELSLSLAGANFLHSVEGVKLKVYDDGKGNMSIGCGHKIIRAGG